jgi:acyl-CoA synthetase (NDP forming)
MSIRHLDSMFDPASVAVVGASRAPASVGATVWRNLRQGGFQGTLMAVNPKHASSTACPCVPRVADAAAAARAGRHLHAAGHGAGADRRAGRGAARARPS